MYELTLAQVRRLYSKFEKGKDDECWPWTSRTAGRADVPSFHWRRRNISPRRMVWEQEGFGELSPKVHLYPTCRNKLCVNPSHMMWQLGGGRQPAETCRRGHDRTDPENIYVNTQGKNCCRACMRIVNTARRRRYQREGRGWGHSYRKAAA